MIQQDMKSLRLKKEAMGKHDTARHEVSPIKERSDGET